MRAWAKGKNEGQINYAQALNLEEVTAAFKDHWRNKKVSRPDWVASWRNWVRVDYNKLPSTRHEQAKRVKTARPTIDPKALEKAKARILAEEAAAKTPEDPHARQRLRSVHAGNAGAG